MKEWGDPLFLLVTIIFVQTRCFVCRQGAKQWREFLREEGMCLASKGKGGNTVAAVWALAEPIARSLGLQLWDVRFVKEGASWYLRVFVDKEGGVSVEDCVAMSHALDGPLDETDPIEQNYYLEVSSPGLARELTRDQHFQAFLGARVRVRLIRPVETIRDFAGELASFEDGTVTLLLEDGGQLQIQKKEASWIRLDDADAF